jgi:ferredoxin--NADP+ reductase
MCKVIDKKKLSENIFRFDIEAPLIAKAAKAGQFVVIRIDEKGERIPLTIADSDRSKSLITLVFQVVGASTGILSRCEVGDEILDILGPLGHPTEVEKFGTVVCVGGGVGIAVVHPVVKAMKSRGNKVITIIGSRCEDALIFRNENKDHSDEFYITTDDGSCGRKGFVSDELKALIEKGVKIDRVIAIGPVPMMKAVANVTKSHNIKTIVSLNPLMLDATGMCGVCRVTVGGATKFACVDGPEFDGHQVDYDELMTRLDQYKDKEKIAMDRCERCKTHPLTPSLNKRGEAEYKLNQTYDSKGQG